MADILFIEAFWLALFNDKVEFIGFFLPYSDKSINFARKTTGDYGYKGRSRIVSLQIHSKGKGIRHCLSWQQGQESHINSSKSWKVHLQEAKQSLSQRLERLFSEKRNTSTPTCVINVSIRRKHSRPHRWIRLILRRYTIVNIKL